MAVPKLNTEIIRELNPCTGRFNNYLKYHKNFNGNVIDFLNLENITVDYKFWVVFKNNLLSEDVMNLFAISCAEDCLNNFETVYPNDDRPRKAIEAKKLFIEGKITEDELEVARSAAARAARVAAGTAAGAAARSAARAAGAAAGAAARSAARAARAARAAAGAAARAARAARAAAGADQNAKLVTIIKNNYKRTMLTDFSTKDYKLIKISLEQQRGDSSNIAYLESLISYVNDCIVESK